MVLLMDNGHVYVDNSKTILQLKTHIRHVMWMTYSPFYVKSRPGLIVPGHKTRGLQVFHTKLSIRKRWTTVMKCTFYSKKQILKWKMNNPVSIDFEALSNSFRNCDTSQEYPYAFYVTNLIPRYDSTLSSPALVGWRNGL